MTVNEAGNKMYLNPGYTSPIYSIDSKDKGGAKTKRRRIIEKKRKNNKFVFLFSLSSLKPILPVLNPLAQEQGENSCHYQ